MNLSTLLHFFFDQYLPNFKGVSNTTLKAYRDTFSLFLKFTATYHSKEVDNLTIHDFSLKLLMRFLDHLETKRKNIPRTRNLRLAALKSFAKMIKLSYPQYKEKAELILNIPQKRAQKTLIGFLTNEEVLDVFKSVDIKTKDGFRDYTILHLLYDSGARASEIATLNIDQFDQANKTLIILGKGTFGQRL
jgi:site-specific recombinase XerD